MKPSEEDLISRKIWMSSFGRSGFPGFFLVQTDDILLPSFKYFISDFDQ